MPTPTLRRQLLLAGALASVMPRARAVGDRPLRLIVPFPPGGTSDIMARAIAGQLAESLHETVVIDNKPGAGGSVGADAAARADADGATLLMGHTGTLAVNPSLYPKLPYDPLKSFVPVALVARVPNVLVVNADKGLRTLKELIARAQAAPGKLSYSSGGNGSAAHIAFEYLKLTAHFAMTHIPYRGTAPSVTDLIAGQVDATFTGSPAVMVHVKSGRLRALAVSSRARLPTFPDVPTVAESGFPGFEADQWYGIVAPAGTPAARVARLNEAINLALALPAVRAPLAAEGAVPAPATAKAFGDLIATEIPRWREVVRAGHVTLE
jgi:tripartite-type tricarboxylate transporter receptor subunit TctC